MRVDESIFLAPFFEALESAGVVHAAMRNGQDLPRTLNGSDLDLIVRSGELERAREIALKVASQNNGKLMGEIRSPRFCELALLGCSNGSWWGVEIDICDGGYVFEPIDGERVLACRERNLGGVWVLNQACADLLGCGKELVMNGALPQKYLAGAGAAVDTPVESCFSDARFRSFVHEAVCAHKPPSRAAWRRMRRHLLARAFWKSPIRFIADQAGFYGSKLKRLVHPIGLFAVVMGTDGSGKSTMINEVLPILGLAFHKSVKVHHLKPDLLPPLGRLRGVKNEPGHVCTDPHGSKPSGFVGSLFRITYLTMDYVLGYWIKVRKHVAKLPVGLWIFDRYAYDILLDPRRFRIALPRWIIKVFLWFVPSPNLIICLGGDPETIYARKPETNLEEVARQVEALKQFASAHRNTVWVDTTLPLEASAGAFLNAIAGVPS